MDAFPSSRFSELYLPLLTAALAPMPSGPRWLTVLSAPALLSRLTQICVSLVANAARFNLTAITDPPAVVEKHILDSLLLLPHLEEGVFPGKGVFPGNALSPGHISHEAPSLPSTVLDIGSGAGFPALPLASALSDFGFTVTALDSTAKKIRHIRETADQIDISPALITVTGRAETLAHSPLRETFALVTARAVAPLPILVELAAAFVTPGGYFAAMKGHASEEVKDARRAAEKLGFAPCRLVEYALPCGDSRSLALYQKIRPTPGLYPRPYAKITAKPLA